MFVIVEETRFLSKDLTAKRLREVYLTLGINPELSGADERSLREGRSVYRGEVDFHPLGGYVSATPGEAAALEWDVIKTAVIDNLTTGA